MATLFKNDSLPAGKDRKFIAFQEDPETASASGNAVLFPSNFIKTSRYTLITFLPVSLLLQFKRYANIYFLCTTVLQCIPIISPLSPYAAIAPLIVVLGISLIREAFEDYTRHKSDKELNYKTKSTRIQSDRTDYAVSWASIHVGDILHIQQDECFPSDLLLLGSNLEGVCYIETGALDGEKNLKPKSALTETERYFNSKEITNSDKIQTEKNIRNKQSFFHLTVSAKAPDQDPNYFAGSIGFELSNQENHQEIPNLKEIPADSNQFLPRGAFLRNTESIYGVVVYTGMDTKIMKNSEKSDPKQSQMEIKMNKYILCVLAFQIICAIVMSACSYYWLQINLIRDHFHYLNLDDGISSQGQSIIAFFSYFILFNTMIPISLVVSLEMVKVLQSYFISHDKEMFSAHNNKWPKVMTSTINEQLGQVEYVFSDKTGTLTQNQMQFKMAVVGNKLYGEAANKKEINKEKRNNELQEIKPQALFEFVFEDSTLEGLLLNQANRDDNPKFDLTLHSLDGKASYTLKDQADLAREYFQILGFTHECIVEKNKDPNDTSLVYQGPSPDEITLVDAANHMGFSFIGKTSNKLQMRLGSSKSSNLKEVTKINIFEFSSARKRNTLILQDNGVYKMYVKGADNVIKDRLNTNIPQPFLENADKKLTEFSIVGLRTLLIGMKIMSQQEIEAFTNSYNELANSQNRKEDLDNLADEIERGFFLIGATAVEDRLQDGVPETIHDLLRANIKVWMLTGDKLETAENIAKSCKLIREDFECLVMSDKNPTMIRKMMTEDLWNRFKYLKENNIKKCFLIEGDCLKVIFEIGNEDIKKKFVKITKECESVVCCRVSPVQKAQVVRAIREGLKKITLAIGDGANDVNMIQAAHIGCGIYGNEGMRAVQSSDFAFGQFKCLWRLLFVHGRWSYIRVSEMIVYFFYKNMIFTIPQLFFSFYSGFSGQSIFDDYYISLYNLIFTSLPLIIRAVFDQDINYMYNNLKKKTIKSINSKDEQLLMRLVDKRKEYIMDKLPSLYYIGQKEQLFTTSIFLSWVFQGLFHGLIIFYISFFAVGNAILNDSGHTSDLWSFSLIIFTSVVFIADNKLALHTRYWTIFMHIAIYGSSIGMYIFVFFVTNYLQTSKVYLAPIFLVSTPHFYLILFLNVTSIFALDSAILWSKELFKNNTKEKALRKLMKQQPKKNQQKDKWLFEGQSLIDIQSDIGSFIDKQITAQSIILTEKSQISKDKQDIESTSKQLQNEQDNGRKRAHSQLKPMYLPDPHPSK